MHCSRAELAGGLPEENGGTYAHRMHGSCRCGTTHGPSAYEPRKRIVAVYPYTDEAGAVLFEAIRFDPKGFAQRKPDGAGGYIWKLNGARRVIYRLHDIVTDDADRVVYIPEGEKDVDELVARGFAATCNPMGAGKWGAVAELARTVLQGREVVVIADGDDVGHAHAREIEASLRDVVRSIRVVESPSPHKDISDLFAAGGTVDDLVPLRTPTPDADRVRALARLGPAVRVSSGFKTLDTDMRGGIPLPRFMVVGGAPGAGKTSLAVGQAVQCAARGIPVVILAKDEGVEGIDERVALLHGISVEALDRRDPAALEALAQIYERLPLRVLDGDDGHTVESAAATLASMQTPGGPALLVVDSAQTADADGTATAKSPRERCDAVMRAAKGVTRKHGFWTIVTSELNRGFYRSKRNEEASNPLAAFKESGGIEYGAQTALVLTSAEGDGTTIDVQVPKNRGFKKTPFRLRIDPATTAVSETDAAPPPSSSSEPGEDRFAKVRSNIIRACSRHADLGSASKIAAAIGGERRYALRVIKALIEDGDLVKVGAGYRPKLEVVS